MYENSFNKIEKYPRAEEGIANELDYVEQKSRVLFLKYLHDLETERRDRAELDSEDYTRSSAVTTGGIMGGITTTVKASDHGHRCG